MYPSSRTYKLGEKRSGSRQIGEIQDFTTLRDFYFSKGRLFEDPTFDAIDSNIFYSKKSPKPFVWKRPNELVDNPHFFVEGVSRFDVVQGELGDCWLLASVSNLTLHPTLFHNVVPEDQGFSEENKYAGIFHFRFWQYGKWIDVVVDDRLPTYGGDLVFLHSEHKNEFWSALLEKAYAKLHGSYEALKGGEISEALADFTGGLTEKYKLDKAPPNLFTIMLKAHDRSSLMGCAIDSPVDNGIELKLANGLIRNHAYSITDVKLVDNKTPHTEGKIQLLRMRNPWGNDEEWNGAWSDQSREWQFIPEQEKKLLGLVAANDGEFWMSFKDFMANFHELEICNLNPNSWDDDEERSSRLRWECKTFEGSWKRGSTAGGCRNFIDTFACNPQYRVVLEDPDEDDDEDTCTLIVALMQKVSRVEKKMGAESLSIGYVIYQLENPKSVPRPLPREFFEENRSIATVDAYTNLREVKKRFKLTPGTYCIIPSTFDPNEEGDFLLRVYTEKKSDINEHDSEVSVTSADENVVKETEKHYTPDLLKTAFLRIAGEDSEVDATELKEVLDFVLKKEFDFDGFGINLCRGMVAMMDTGFSGKLEFEEFTELWRNIRTWKGVFKLYDKNNSGSLTSFELRNALASAGYSVNWHILKVLTLRYANKNNEVSFEDFIVCAVKLKTMIEAFKERTSNGSNEATFKIDEWLTLTMYA